jgi:hypothetical protein
MSPVDEIRKPTFIKKLAFYPWFYGSAKGISAHEFEILRSIVHFLPLQVGDDYVDVVAAVIVHTPEEHQFR